VSARTAHRSTGGIFASALAAFFASEEGLSMKSPFRLLKCIGKAVFNWVGGSALGDLAAVLPDVVNDAWDWGRGDKDEPQRPRALQALAQAAAEDLAEQVEAVVVEVAGDQPAPVRRMLTTYLTQVPAAVRQSLRRSTDPTGRTVPPGLSLRRAEDLLP